MSYFEQLKMTIEPKLPDQLFFPVLIPLRHIHLSYRLRFFLAMSYFGDPLVSQIHKSRFEYVMLPNPRKNGN